MHRTTRIARDEDVDVTGRDDNNDDDDDDAGDDASYTTSDEGDNRDAAIAIATPHRRQRRLCIGKGEDTGSASSLAAGEQGKKNNSNL